MKVRTYMTESPHTIGVEQSLAAARRLMTERHVRHLPVLRDEQPVGVLSQREVDSLAVLPGSSRLTVDEAMVSEVYVTSGDASLADVVAEMARRNVSSAVVMAGGEGAKVVVGVFTVVEALRALADALRPSPRAA